LYWAPNPKKPSATIFVPTVKVAGVGWAVQVGGGGASGAEAAAGGLTAGG
jgi:hypothetical protein